MLVDILPVDVHADSIRRRIRGVGLGPIHTSSPLLTSSLYLFGCFHILYEAHKPAVSVQCLAPIIFGARTLDE